LGPAPQGATPLADCDALLKRLDGLPRQRQNDYLVRRLREALQHVQHCGSSATLDEHLKYLADLEAGRLYSSFALVRVIIWAIPILGFLGTVIGITLAIANLTPNAVEDSLPQVVQGLSVAFSTTTQALTLSIVLMFAQYYTNQKESALLDQVDHRAAVELDGRFEQIPAGPDGQLVAVRRMAETMVQGSERLVQRQSELWQKSMGAASARWTQMANTAGEQLQRSLSGALAESLKAHARLLADAQQSTAQQNHRHWQQVQQTQVQNAQAMASLQTAMARQTEMLGRAVEATGEVSKLEVALNRNLATLAGAKHFEQTVMSLAAVINLLGTRLAEGPIEASAVRLETKVTKRDIQAA
jgi:cell division septum initiation protein DivIVA